MLSQLTSTGKPCVRVSKTPNADFSCIIRNKTLRDGRRHGPVLSEPICGLVSTFSGLRSNDLSDECCFSSQGSHSKRNADPWNWSRGKGAGMIQLPWTERRRDRLVLYSLRCTSLTPSRRVGDNGIRGQDMGQQRDRNSKTTQGKKEMPSAQS